MLVITLRVTQRDRDSLPARGGSSLPNLAPFARRGRATGQRTYCPCSVCSEPEAHPLQAVRGLAAALCTPTRPGIRAGCGSLAPLAGHRLIVTADPRPLVGSIHVAVARKCSR